MSTVIQCDRCGKTESVGMSETFNGPFREALRSGYYLRSARPARGSPRWRRRSRTGRLDGNQLDFCSQCATAFLALLRGWLSEREP